MASALNEDSVEKKLRTVINTQDSIQSLSLWIIHHKYHHAKIVELWMKVLKKSTEPSHRLTLFYLCNDVVQTCKKKKAYVYNATFKEYLRDAAVLVRDPSVKNKMERIFNIWGERGVYDKSFIKSLQSILNGQSVKTLRAYAKLEAEEELHNAPVSPASSPPVVLEPKEVVAVAHPSETTTERNAEESARILAEFKPHEMIDQVTSFRRQEVEIQLKVSQLSHLKLDASSLEAVRQLKDRAHGNDFSNNFEDSCTKLEDLVKRQTRYLEDQSALIETLCLSETFYEEQYREAKIVANAYKNFGSRINNMKKKLDELRRSMPEADSPMPSPDMNAPSPGHSPTYVSGSSYGYNPAAPMNYGQSLQKSWDYNGTSGASNVNTDSQDNSTFPGITFPDSPPLEAPSPEGSPPDLNLEASDNVSLDSRLASFFDRNRPDAANPPVYTPQLARQGASSSKLKLTGDDDGSTTPLDDETPTTPVQDENLVSPPKRNTPPKKENPIDFLSRLISQTQKTPVKTGAQSFLDSLAMLTTAPKKADNESQQQTAVAQSWAAWKQKTSDSSTSPNQLPSPLYPPTSSQSTLYSSTPTMVPPPIPLPVPPPVSLSMGMNVPPPPPPPFGLATVISTNFSTPPPNFQHTSPGQKENWPDMKPSPNVDHSSSGRSAHSSVLKELVPADGLDAPSGPYLSKERSSSMMDPDAMEIVSEEEEEDDDDEDDDMVDEKLGAKSSETVNDAKAEFAQKLKQKTSQGLIKSHVFVPNPERPNLMTLTVSDDVDEESMADEDTLTKRDPDWQEKPHKSDQKSRSRSRSREKSHKHKKKKKHKRTHSSDEGSPYSAGEDDSKAISSVGSIVKRIDSHTSRNSRDSNKGDKYEDRKYEKYDDDRRYDRYDGGGHSGRGDYGAYKSYRGSKDVKDPVEAYTQAYRDAFFQQYSRGRFNLFPPGPPPPPMDSRRSGYGKY